MKNRTRGIIAVLLSAVMAAGLSACGTASTGSARHVALQLYLKVFQPLLLRHRQKEAVLPCRTDGKYYNCDNR